MDPITAVEPGTSPHRHVHAASRRDTTAFADALDRAAAIGPATGRITLGQMLRGYASSGRLTAAPATSAVVDTPAARGPAVARTSGSELGVGPTARPLATEVGSVYGPRRHPIHGDVRMHHGVDMAAPTGTPIHAFAAGTVTFAGPRGGYGNVVIVEHAGGVETRYAHQSAVDVAVGQQVAAGQPLGRVGATGTATGPHLHFELRRGGDSIDPDPYLP